jgi:tetratricopeptide (TPR) repeat protein
LALTKIPRYQGRFEDALRLLEIGIATDSMELGMCIETSGKYWISAIINDFFGDEQKVIDDLMRAISISEEQEARNIFSGAYKAYLSAKLAEEGEQSGADSLLYDISAAITETGFPDSTDYWLALGFRAIKLHEYSPAVTYWEKLVKNDPYSFTLVFYLGMSYLGSGQLSSAVETLEKAVNIHDDSRGFWPGLGVLCHYLLGKAYEASGWNDKAIEQYETFLDIWKNADPGIKEIDDAKERLARLKNQI